MSYRVQTARNKSVMISRFFSRSRTATLGLVGLGLAALAGCQKPTPLVTVVHGTSSAHDQAACYSRANQPVNTPTCGTGHKAKAVDVAPGDVIGIGVDPEIAETGWFISLGDEHPISAGPLTTTYVEIQLPAEFLVTGSARLRVEQKSDGDSAPQGVWFFELT